MKKALMMTVTFVAGMAVVGTSFAFRGNQEVQSAVSANDYSAFVAVAPENLLERVDSQEAFTDFAQKHRERQSLHQEMKIAVEEAVAANDFAAFQEIHDAHRVAMEEMRPEHVGMHAKKAHANEQGMAQRDSNMQEHFSALVAYYAANGELPEDHQFGMMHSQKGPGHGMKGAGGCNTIE